MLTEQGERERDRAKEEEGEEKAQHKVDGDYINPRGSMLLPTSDYFHPNDNFVYALSRFRASMEEDFIISSRRQA